MPESSKGGGRSVPRRATPPPLDPPDPGQTLRAPRQKGEVLEKTKPRDYRVVFYVQKKPEAEAPGFFCGFFYLSQTLCFGVPPPRRD